MKDVFSRILSDFYMSFFISDVFNSSRNAEGSRSDIDRGLIIHLILKMACLDLLSYASKIEKIAVTL